MKIAVTCLIFLLSAAFAQAATGSVCNSEKTAAFATGFLLVVPDRGFSGNETVRDAFVPLAASCNAELIFITDERSRPYVEQAVQRLRSAGASELAVLPLFISRAHPRFALIRTILEQVWDNSSTLRYSRTFGESYLAVEMLVQRIRDAQATDSNTIVLAGYGAEDASSAHAMAGDLERIAAWAAADTTIMRIQPVIWPAYGVAQGATLESAAWQQLKDASASISNTTVVPFHLGKRLDSMMSFDAWLQDEQPQETRFATPDEDEGLFFSLWMEREANRYLSSKGGRPGVVFLAHGADFNWNQTMRDSVQELAKKYPIEFAFSMADAPSIRRAVERLELRGVAAVVIVRVFGMPDSFRDGIERLIGADVEAGNRPHKKSHGQYGNHQAGPPLPRLRTSTLVTTAGGLGDHRLFARALLERATALSQNPERETIILVAHGKGTEQANRLWLEVLDSLAVQMRLMSDDAFRDIRYQTWREDWPDERAPSVDSVRALVQAARKDGGTAIVVAARTTGTGPAESFLEGLDYQLAPGFAPHALFSQWVEEQIEAGISTIRASLQYSLPNSTDQDQAEPYGKEPVLNAAQFSPQDQ